MCTKGNPTTTQNTSQFTLGSGTSQGAQNQSSSSVLGPNPQTLALYNQFLQQAQALSGTPFEANTQQQIAPWTWQQDAAVNTLVPMATAGQQFVPQAAGMIQGGAQSTIGQIPGVASSILSPWAQQAVDYGTSQGAQISDWAKQEGIKIGDYATSKGAQLGDYAMAQGAMIGDYGTSQGKILGDYATSQGAKISQYGIDLAARGPQLQQFSQAAVDQYLSPYVNDVVNATQNQFTNANAQQGNVLLGQGIKAGNAFGGDRAGIAAAQLANQQQLAQAPVIAGLYNQGYAQALGEYNQQNQLAAQLGQMALQAQEAGGQLGVQGLTAGDQLGLQGLIAGGQLGVQGLTAGDQLGLQGLLGGGQLSLQGQLGGAQLGLQGLGLGLNASTAANSSAIQALGQNQNAALQGGQMLGNLGAQQLGSNVGALGAAYGAGQSWQNYLQSQLNAQTQNAQMQAAYPFQTSSWYGNLLAGIGGLTGTQQAALSNAAAQYAQQQQAQQSGIGITTPPQANQWIQAAGLGLAGLGLFLKDGGGVPRRASGGGGLTGMPYGGAPSYIPSINMPIGHLIAPQTPSSSINMPNLSALAFASPSSLAPAAQGNTTNTGTLGDITKLLSNPTLKQGLNWLRGPSDTAASSTVVSVPEQHGGSVPRLATGGDALISEGGDLPAPVQADVVPTADQLNQLFAPSFARGDSLNMGAGNTETAGGQALYPITPGNGPSGAPAAAAQAPQMVMGETGGLSNIVSQSPSGSIGGRPDMSFMGHGFTTSDLGQQGRVPDWIRPELPAMLRSMQSGTYDPSQWFSVVGGYIVPPPRNAHGLWGPTGYINSARGPMNPIDTGIWNLDRFGRAADPYTVSKRGGAVPRRDDGGSIGNTQPQGLPPLPNIWGTPPPAATTPQQAAGSTSVSPPDSSGSGAAMSAPASSPAPPPLIGPAFLGGRPHLNAFPLSDTLWRGGYTRRASGGTTDETDARSQNKSVDELIAGARAIGEQSPVFGTIDRLQRKRRYDDGGEIDDSGDGTVNDDSSYDATDGEHLPVQAGDEGPARGIGSDYAASGEGERIPLPTPRPAEAPSFTAGLGQPSRRGPYMEQLPVPQRQQPGFMQRWAANPLTQVGLALASQNSPTALGGLGIGLTRGLGAVQAQQARQEQQDRLDRQYRIDNSGMEQVVHFGNGQVWHTNLKTPKALEAERKALEARAKPVKPTVVGEDKFGRKIYGVPDPDNPSGYLDPVTRKPLNQQTAAGPPPTEEERTQVAAGSQPPAAEQEQAQPFSAFTPETEHARTNDPNLLLQQSTPAGVHPEVLQEAESEFPGMAATIKAISEGRQKFPTLSRNNVYNRALINYLHKYDPGADETSMSRRQLTARNFGTGVEGRNLTAANTLGQHTEQLWNLSEKLKQSGYPTFNALRNAVARQGVDKATQELLGQWDITSKAVADESAKVFAGTNSALADRQHWVEMFSPNDPEEVTKKKLQSLVKLVDGRIDSLAGQYNYGMRTDHAPRDFLTPGTRSVFDRIRGGSAGTETGTEKGEEHPDKKQNGILYKWIDGGYKPVKRIQ